MNKKQSLRQIKRMLDENIERQLGPELAKFRRDTLAEPLGIFVARFVNQDKRVEKSHR